MENFPDSAFAKLLDAAIDEALSHEDPQRFLLWCQDQLPQFITGINNEFPAAPDETAHLSLVLGRSIWNAIPLPSNGLQPKRLAEPGRNEPCFCGSGRKYKQCCARFPQPLEMDSDEMLTMVLPRLPKKTLAQLQRTGHLPIQGLTGLAIAECEASRPRKAVEILEPVFTGEIHNGSEAHDHALNLLLDCYDELGWHRKKDDLLKHVLDTAPRSPLRSGAWQRQATILMDHGEIAAAWQAFRKAQQEDPDSPNIGLLEVQLHLGSGEPGKARERAGFWVKRLQRQGWDPREEIIRFLSAVADDPAKAMADAGFGLIDNAGTGLRDWLIHVSGRPLPDGYSLSDGTQTGKGDFSKEALRERFRKLGLPSENADKALDVLTKELNTHPQELIDKPDSPYIKAPPKHDKLSAAWHHIFPLEKPFSVHNQALDADADAWNPESETAWSAFLEKHPEAFDNLDILDDLATALFQHPQIGGGWVEEGMLLPILRRAESILEHLLAKHPGATLEWAWTENRPALRCIARQIIVHLHSGRDDLAAKKIKRLLQLNPNDNHGFRFLLANHWLAQNEDTRMLELASDYPDDVSPEILYGRVLALYRQQQLNEAREALTKAVQTLPRVAHFLTAKRVRKPKIDEYGVRIGGDDQAWLYRDAMRDTWLAVPGAIDWLSKTAKSVQQT